MAAAVSYAKWTKKLAIVFLIGGLVFSCGDRSKKDSTHIPEKNAQTENKTKAEKKGGAENNAIVLYEEGIGPISLPFPEKEMLHELRQSFKSLHITKETGQQDGPDFPLYSLQKDGKEIAYFSMDYKDTLKLVEIRIGDSTIVDAYGLKVGDSYKTITKLRTGNIKTQTDYHGHTYVTINSSNIGYEIVDNAPTSKGPDSRVTPLTDAQLQDWKIEYLVWKN